ncbi:MAG: SURF1 family protein [Rhodobiaceae bacterium]|nr:SURF1 family protein [Rhodobiaceae bacterium]
MTQPAPASRRAIAFASVMALIGIAVTVSLGIWQMQRLVWKQDLLARIERRLSADPVSLDEALRLAAAGDDVEYLRVALSGRYVEGANLYLYSIGQGGAAGYEVFTPLMTAPDQAVIVNRGFVPQDQLDAIATPPGDRTIVALVREPGRQTLFTPDNDVAGNRWYWRDIAGMTAEFRATALKDGTIEIPQIAFAAEPDAAPGWPRAGATRLDIPNNHLQYVFTWFAFAVIQAVVFLIWFTRQRRLRLADAGDRE